MLRQRVLTAAVLLAFLLPALFAPVAWPFGLLTLVGMAAAGWEWAVLNSAGPRAAVAFGVLLGAGCAATAVLGWAVSPPPIVWWVVTLVWVLGGAWALKAGPRGWPGLPLPLRWGLGWFALWAAWLALAHARVIGVNFVLSILCLVWVSDIAAYFGGRAYGRRKLAVAISPGKSWEGVWSGMLGVGLLAAAWIAIEHSASVDSASLYSGLLGSLSTASFVLMLAFLCAMSVVGDLVESLVKRSAGAKDSSGLLPGHGGILDRVDALLPVFPIALALNTLR